MNTFLIIHAADKKRPQRLLLQPGGLGCQPFVGLRLCLPQFKKPHFEVTEIQAVQNTSYAPQFVLSQPPAMGGTWGGGYAPRPLFGPAVEEEDTDLPQDAGQAQFMTLVVCEPCEPFDVPGFAALGKAAAEPAA